MLLNINLTELLGHLTTDSEHFISTSGKSHIAHMHTQTHTHTHTHTHNRFTALLDFVRDYPGEPAPERCRLTRVVPRKVKPIWIYWNKR